MKKDEQHPYLADMVEPGDLPDEFFFIDVDVSETGLLGRQFKSTIGDLDQRRNKIITGLAQYIESKCNGK